MNKNIQKRIEKIQEQIMSKTEYKFVPSEEKALSAKKKVLAFRKHFPDFTPSTNWEEPDDNEDIEIRCTAWLRNLADVLRALRLKPEILENARKIPELESLVGLAYEMRGMQGP